MTRHTIITPELKQQVVAMFQARKANGWNQKIIAQSLGISERSVKRTLDEAGLATAVPLTKGEAHQVLKALEEVKLQPVHLRPLLKTLEMMGIGILTNEDKVAVTVPAPTRGQIIKALSEMEDGTWGALLNEVVTARVARSVNVGVQTAMLNISNAVDKNAKPGHN